MRTAETFVLELVDGCILATKLRKLHFVCIPMSLSTRKMGDVNQILGSYISYSSEDIYSSSEEISTKPPETFLQQKSTERPAFSQSAFRVGKVSRNCLDLYGARAPSTSVTSSASRSVIVVALAFTKHSTKLS